MAGTGEDVYCTLLMGDSYLPGAVVLARSLRDAGTKKKLAILVTLDSLLPETVSELRELYDYMLPVERIANPNLENLMRLDRLDLRFAFTKLALWRQEQFRKIVYVDADVVALRAPDELFDLDSSFAAAPDIGWPDIFNSGVMVLSPNISEYWSLNSLASSGTSFDGADQGLLNEYYANKPWQRLSFTYNCTPNAGYQYEPAYRHFRSNISMVHFIGKNKPWLQGRQALDWTSPGVYRELLGRWWAVYDRHYRLPATSAIGQATPASRTVQQYVKGEQTESLFDWRAAPSQQSPATLPALAPPPPTPELQPLHAYPTASSHSATSTLGAQTQESKSIEPAIYAQNEQTPKGQSNQTTLSRQEVIAPVLTRQEPVFSPPQNQWDATRSEPPAESRPEASNFPSARYEMSHDPGLFHAPTSYPQPPVEVRHQLPSTAPAMDKPPKPIFPWEQTAKKATRIFPDDLPHIAADPEAPAVHSQDFTGQAGDSGEKAATSPLQHSPGTPMSRNPAVVVSYADPWQAYSRINAWDEISSINNYVHALKQAQDAQRKGKVQVLYQQAESTIGDLTEDVNSPPLPRRRESLILTDFPTEVERPSLPVTPAPIQRQIFWGNERDEDGNLPAAEGVPEQADWVCPQCGYATRLRFHIFSLQLPTSVSSMFHDPSNGNATAAPFAMHHVRPQIASTALSQAIRQGLTRDDAQLTSPSSSTKDPHEKLEQLRHSSLIAAEELPYIQQQEAPQRGIPESSKPQIQSRPFTVTESSKPSVQTSYASPSFYTSAGTDFHSTSRENIVTETTKSYPTSFSTFPRNVSEPDSSISAGPGPSMSVSGVAPPAPRDINDVGHLDEYSIA